METFYASITNNLISNGIKYEIGKWYYKHLYKIQIIIDKLI